MAQLKPLPKVCFQAQDPDEKVYLLLRKAFVTNYPWIFGGIILSFLPLIFILFFSSYAEWWLDLPSLLRIFLIILWYLALWGFMMVQYAKWFYRVFLVTSSRVMDIDLVGFLYRDVAEARWQHIQDVSHHQGGLLQLLFNYGDVYVQTAGSEQNIELLDVYNPGYVHDVITDLMVQSS